MAQYKKYGDLNTDGLGPSQSYDKQPQQGQGHSKGQDKVQSLEKGPGLNSNFDPIVKLENMDHKTKIIKSNKVVMIDVYGDWCQPCVAIAPQIAELALRYNKPGVCAIVKENIDLKIPLVNSLDPKHKSVNTIRGVPCFLFYVNGTINNEDTIAGGDIPRIKQTLERLLAT